MQAADDGHEIAGPIGDGVAGIVVNGNPNLRSGSWEMEIGRHDAEDLAADAFEFDSAANDGRIAAETLLPEGVAEDYEIVLAGSVVSGMERSTELRADTEKGEEFRGDNGSGEAERFSVMSEIEFVAFEIGGDVEGFDLITQGNECAFWIRASEAD